MKHRTSRLLFLLFLSAVTVVCVAQVRRISQEPVTTTVANGDDFLINVQVGSNYTTRRIAWSNLVAGLTNSGGVTITNGTNVLYVSSLGNDSTALRGRMDKPWLTVSNALERMTNGDTLVVAPGNYTNTAVIHIGDGAHNAAWNLLYKTNVVLDFQHAKFWWPTQLSGLLIRHCDGVRVKGLESFNDKSDPNPPAWMTNKFSTSGVWGAVTIADAAHVVIEDCIFAHLWDHGVVAENLGYTFEKATNSIIVRDCLIFDTGWKWSSWYDGVCISLSSGWAVYNNYLYDTARGIEPFPLPESLQGGTERPVLVANNFVWNCKAEGICGDRFSGLITGNVIGRDPDYPEDAGTGLASGIGLDHALNLTVSGNEIINRETGIYVKTHSTNVVIKGNTIRGGAIALKANASEFDHLTVSGNDCYDISHWTWLLSSATFNKCRWVDNHFWNCSTNSAGPTTVITATGSTWYSNAWARNTFDSKWTRAVSAADFSTSTGTGNSWIDNRIWDPIVTELAGGSGVFDDARIQLRGWGINRHVETGFGNWTNLCLSLPDGSPVGLALGDSTPFSGIGIVLQPDDLGSAYETLSLLSPELKDFGSYRNLRAANGYFSGTVYGTSSVVTASITLGGDTRTSWPTASEVARNPATNATYTLFLSTNTTMMLTNSQSGNISFSLSNPVDRCWFILRVVGGSAGCTNVFLPMDGTASLTWLATNGCPNATNPAAASGKVCTVSGRVWVSPSPPSTNVDLFANVQP